MKPRRAPAKLENDPTSAQRILKVAEELIAAHGLNGVSMRQISDAAGCANPFSVQYHFGDKIKLVQSIIDSHQPWLELRRGELLDRATAAGLGANVRALLEASLLPMAELTNEKGEEVYLRMLWQVMRPELAIELPITPPRLPRSVEIWSRLRAALPACSEDVFAWRKDNAIHFFLYAVTTCGPFPFNAKTAPGDALPKSFYIADALDMAAAILTAKPAITG